MRVKSASAYRTITELADEMNVGSHVLRYWETQFSKLRPLRRGGGRRYYDVKQRAIAHRIRELLHGEGYTIAGAKQLFSQNRLQDVLNGTAKVQRPLKAAMLGGDTLSTAYELRNAWLYGRNNEVGECIRNLIQILESKQA